MSPAERVVLVLQDVFEFSFEKVATGATRALASAA